MKKALFTLLSVPCFFYNTFSFSAALPLQPDTELVTAHLTLKNIAHPEPKDSVSADKDAQQPQKSRSWNFLKQAAVAYVVHYTKSALMNAFDTTPYRDHYNRHTLLPFSAVLDQGEIKYIATVFGEATAAALAAHINEHIALKHNEEVDARAHALGWFLAHITPKPRWFMKKYKHIKFPHLRIAQSHADLHTIENARAQKLSPESCKEMVCPICLDAINTPNTLGSYIPPCLHQFHRSCISQWCNTSAPHRHTGMTNIPQHRCPTCRADLGNEASLLRG